MPVEFIGMIGTKNESEIRLTAGPVIDPDYVERCVDALETSSAAIVGGPMRFTAEGPVQRGIAAAMRSRLGRSEERRVGKECRSRWSPYH